ncbi:hypothetical protein A1Q2_00289 [Trichosporon asahii var. asahii CBS 8904]|uniref:Uncharacterized protein n=1 Tax=Trichosporon asahii var. asahii (strain CBS 8904) TaxID=1220162 RepID=K1W9S2_TRIAC|nr:hypothetical protein A1Q2_00289 [Trichosporon asahii var. asahii CBS 8904]
MFASIIPLALLVAPAVSGAASWWTIRQGESFLRLVECYQSDSDSTDEPHVYCTLNLETPRLGPLDTCHVKWFFDPAVTGEVTTEAGHFLGSRAWEPWNGGRIDMAPAVNMAGVTFLSAENRTWTFRESGHIELGHTNYCLDFKDGNIGTYGTGLFQLWECVDHNPNQIWKLCARP